MIYSLIVNLRSKLLVFLTHHLALPLLKLIRSPQKFQYTKEALHQLPEGTLGKELAIMLDEKNLKLLPYYAKHDIKHILLQYDTTDEGEVCLQCFMLGNKHLSFPVMATVIYGVISMPEYWSKFSKAYKRGSHCQPIEHWQWFTLLHQPVQLLRRKLDRL
ncbi:MAG: Coq4 family protein [Sediminibacterium sp.]